jgi:hypothetical protein
MEFDDNSGREKNPEQRSLGTIREPIGDSSDLNTIPRQTFGDRSVAENQRTVNYGGDTNFKLYLELGRSIPL